VTTECQFKHASVWTGLKPHCQLIMVMTDHDEVHAWDRTEHTQ